MKRILIAASILFGFGLQAQDLPAPSPSATIEQRIGLTDFTLKYSRPSAKGREIYGSLVPYNEIWRTGANKATSLEFNTPIQFGDTEVPAGTYSLFTIPNEGAWVVILNKNTELWGADGYSEEQDVARVEVKAEQAHFAETFTAQFVNFRDGNSADLHIHWADQKVNVPIKVEVQSVALANIEKALKESKEEDLWRVNRNAANYYLQNNLDMEQALAYISKSVELNAENWYSHYMHGEILFANGKAKDAKKAAKMALKLGQESSEKAGREFSYAGMVEAAIEKYSK